MVEYSVQKSCGLFGEFFSTHYDTKVLARSPEEAVVRFNKYTTGSRDMTISSLSRTSDNWAKWRVRRKGVTVYICL
jgi:hypothetical protein